MDESIPKIAIDEETVLYYHFDYSLWETFQNTPITGATVSIVSGSSVTVGTATVSSNKVQVLITAVQPGVTLVKCKPTNGTESDVFRVKFVVSDGDDAE